jgi:hypothetical protein
MGNEKELVDLVGGFNSSNINNLKTDRIKREFKVFQYEEKLFNFDSNDYVDKLQDDLNFLNINKKLEIFCNKYQLETIAVYVSKENIGVMYIELESARLNLIMIDILLMFMTNHFGFNFYSEEGK